jgi:hypothetical protein
MGKIGKGEGGPSQFFLRTSFVNHQGTYVLIKKKKVREIFLAEYTVAMTTLLPLSLGTREYPRVFLVSRRFLAILAPPFTKVVNYFCQEKKYIYRISYL